MSDKADVPTIDIEQAMERYGEIEVNGAVPTFVLEEFVAQLRDGEVIGGALCGSDPPYWRAVEDCVDALENLIDDQ